MQSVKTLFVLLVLLGAEGLAQAANKTWTGAISTDWFNSGNWNPAGVPGEGDAVFVASGNPVAGSSLIVASLSLSGGTCTFDGPTQLGALNQTGGTLGGTNLLVATNLVWTGGTMQGLGMTLVPPGGSLRISVPLNNWVYLSQRVLHNAGSAGWTNLGRIYGYNGAVITNRGAWEVQSDSAMYWNSSGAKAVFLNGGLFIKTGGTGTTLFNDTAFHNSGTTRVDRGTLQLAAGGSASGGFEVASNAFLNFSGGTHLWEATARVSGPGRVQFGVGTTFNGNNFTVGRLELPSTSTFNAPVTVETLTVSGNGSFNGPLQAQTVTLTGSAGFNGSASLGTVSLTGTAAATFNGPATVSGVNFSGGTLGGTNVVVVTNLVWT
jgi:hypothetical protein